MQLEQVLINLAVNARDAMSGRGTLFVDLDRVTADDATHGMPAGQLPAVGWQKSSRSNPSGNCVELTRLHGSPDIAVRNSRDPEGPALVYTPEEMAAFIEGARGGDFDHLIA